MGAEVNAGTGKETTSVYSRFLDNHLERAFDVLQDMVLRPAYPDIDSERQVVIEEIAMYEDEPQDKVHDVLAGAIFGDHPLGRPIIGRADVVSSVPGAGDRLVARRPLRAGQHGAGRGREPRARADRRAGRAGLRRRDRGRARRRMRLARAERPGAPLPPEGDRAVPPLPRRPGHPARRRPPLRAAGARHDPRRLDLLAPVPGGAREARARLLGLLVREPLRRHRPGGALRGHAAGQRGGGARGDRLASSAACTTTA